jgi:hypothetical protein
VIVKGLGQISPIREDFLDVALEVRAVRFGQRDDARLGHAGSKDFPVVAGHPAATDYSDSHLFHVVNLSGVQPSLRLMAANGVKPISKPEFSAFSFCVPSSRKFTRVTVFRPNSVSS